MKDELAISIRGLKKQYRLGQIGGGTLQADLQSWIARMRHQEDPNSKLINSSYSQNKQFMALDGIDLDVKKGEALGIIGHNGAGKSTLLKILSRVTAPTAGTVDIYGRVTSMLEVGTGFNGEMTGRENIYLNGAILGMSKYEINRKMEDIIEFSECREFIDTPVKRYSSGMYVKLAFSVAAHLDSEIMIMDEILAVGDVKFQQKCLGRMEDATGQEGRTVLYVSHNMNTIRQFCTRCIVLKSGKIIYDGDVENAISAYMEDSFSKTQTDIDLSGRYQKWLSPFPKIKMTRLLLLEKETAVYALNEPLKFRITFRANRRTDKVSLRFEVRSADESSIGTAFLFDLICLNEEEKSMDIGFDTTGLIPGKYGVVLGVFEKNEFGGYTDIDVIDDAFSFEVRDDNNELGIIWLRSFWGSMKLNDLKLLQ